MANIGQNKKNIISDCRGMILILKEKLAEMKAFLLDHSLESETDEINFFKYQKPTLLGQLIYFYKLLRIESQRPFNTEELDKYYEKQQEEQNLFFDRHISFFQYYRSGSTYRDAHHFLRGRQEDLIDADICPFEEALTFPQDMTNLSHELLRWRCCMPFFRFVALTFLMKCSKS